MLVTLFNVLQIPSQEVPKLWSSLFIWLFTLSKSNNNKNKISVTPFKVYIIASKLQGNNRLKNVYMDSINIYIFGKLQTTAFNIYLNPSHINNEVVRTEVNAKSKWIAYQKLISVKLSYKDTEPPTRQVFLRWEELQAQYIRKNLKEKKKSHVICDIHSFLAILPSKMLYLFLPYDMQLV